MKKYFCLIIIPTVFFLSGCLKNLEDEGVTNETTIKGRVVDAQRGHAATGIRIRATNGTRQGGETITKSDGSFTIQVTTDELHDGYYLHLSADSLYRSVIYPLDHVGYGLTNYDLQTITVDGPELPQLTTDAVSGIEQQSAIGGGSIIDNGRCAIRHRGICWSTAANPTVVNNHTSDGNGDGHFTTIINNLQPGTTYHARAYAINAVGTAYGQDVTFTTLTGIPVVNTTTITDVTQHSVNCGGNVTSDNGHAVTERGMCYSSTSITPTLNDSRLTCGSGSGTFMCQITNLQSNTTYYIRAYATNSEGTGFGEVKTVTTF